MDKQIFIDEEASRKLIAELGLEGLPQDKQEELMSQMTEALIERILMRAMESLSDADRESFGKLIDDNANPEVMENFLTEKIPGYGKMVEKIIGEFKEEMKQS
jgi:hypothetical protein